ncbi:hypothetical protein [Adhaeribacter arboris]|uniref:hypothetical protein n=1 Tax=Adhaeribacter arboris TaxID=2072846 RepID=UPI001304B91B|nr:hypothetical protein [Adhaeribacter arboris]
MATLLSFGACKDLDEEVYSAAIPENFFQTKDQVMAGFVMPYAFMQTHIYQVHFALQEFVTDEAVAPVRGATSIRTGPGTAFTATPGPPPNPGLNWNGTICGRR